MEDKNYSKDVDINWEFVEKALNEGTLSGYKMAVIETEKILAKTLQDKGYFGKTTEERLENAMIFLEVPEKLNYARSMYKKIINEPGFDIFDQDTKSIISAYHESFEDLLAHAPAKSNILSRIELALKYYFKKITPIIKKIVGGIIVFIISVLFLADTSTGQQASQIIVDFVRFIVYKLLLIIIGGVALVIMVILTWSYWKKRKKILKNQKLSAYDEDQSLT